MVKIGFIGAGRLAQALTKGFISKQVTNVDKVIASTIKDDYLSVEEMKKLGCKTIFNNIDVVNNSDVIILSVKPQVINDVVAEISNSVNNEKLIISTAIGITIDQLEMMLPSNSRIIRVMTNTPVVVGEGASVFALGSSTNLSDANIVNKLFSSVGLCEQVSEHAIDAVTGVSGSGPAYCFLAIESLADGGVKQGLSRDLALKLAAQTLIGSGKMVLETKLHPGILKDNVCSPSGSTIQAITHLEKAGFRASLIDAVEIAANICRETRDKLSFSSKEIKKVPMSYLK